MAVIRVEVERDIAAPPERVYRCIADYKNEHGRWLPANYSAYAVEQGGDGGGTIFRYHFAAGRRERDYRMAVAEPAPGSTLTESDTNSSLVNTWTVTPRGNGAHVALRTEWQGSGGVGGFFERTFAPTALKRIHGEALAGLDRCATGKA